jgi:hypothetical protein
MKKNVKEKGRETVKKRKWEKIILKKLYYVYSAGIKNDS